VGLPVLVDWVYLGLMGQLYSHEKQTFEGQNYWEQTCHVTFVHLVWGHICLCCDLIARNGV